MKKRSNDLTGRKHIINNGNYYLIIIYNNYFFSFNLVKNNIYIYQEEKKSR